MFSLFAIFLLILRLEHCLKKGIFSFSCPIEKEKKSISMYE